eukprot:CAMPEP_0179999858 /NCGR_PEP_ID=MMETSP0984-20121128/9497_1 /TAXON_ID=483367 /ORGANISM="non described non described, Strain CCMP 2436" /LENGTH=94 /DNA_ID=CAMNT_0021919753 /DNA_START=103 /DNA_END=384 /DNA_ORIENTATION=-
MSNEGCVQHRGVQSRAQDAGDPFRSFQVADDIEDADLHDEDIGQQKRPGQMQVGQSHSWRVARSPSRTAARRSRQLQAGSARSDARSARHDTRR